MIHGDDDAALASAVSATFASLLISETRLKEINDERAERDTDPLERGMDATTLRQARARAIADSASGRGSSG